MGQESVGLQVNPDGGVGAGVGVGVGVGAGVGGGVGVGGIGLEGPVLLIKLQQIFNSLEAPSS